MNNRYITPIRFLAIAFYLLGAAAGFAQLGLVPADRPPQPGALNQISKPMPDLTGIVVTREH